MSSSAPSLHEWFGAPSEGQLAVDLFRRGSFLVIRAAIAGVDPNALAISVHNDLLTIRGERTHQEAIEKEDWFHQECYWGAFSRSILLPEDVDEHAIEATMKHGILEIRLPIKASHKKIVVRPLDEETA